MIHPYLSTFITVADAGSFTKAAEALLLSPTAVMKQINQFEADLDLTLLKRTHQGATLTQSGKIIYDAGKQLIASAEKAVNAAKAAEAQENHTITIGTSIMCPCRSLIDIWYKINNRYPTYKIKIVPFEEDHTNTLTNLKNKTTNFDAIVSPCDSENWLKAVNFLKLGETRYCFSVPPDHPFAGRKSVSLSDLHGQTVMISGKGDSEKISTIRDAIVTQNTDVTLEDIPFFYDIDVFNRCAEEGSALLSLDFWDHIHPSLVTVPLEEDFKINYGVIYRKAPNAALKNFIRIISKNL